MSAFLRYVGGESPLTYPELYRWSVLHPEEFWPKVWSFYGVIATDLGGGRGSLTSAFAAFRSWRPGAVK